MSICFHGNRVSSIVNTPLEECRYCFIECRIRLNEERKFRRHGIYGSQIRRHGFSKSLLRRVYHICEMAESGSTLNPLIVYRDCDGTTHSLPASDYEAECDAHMRNGCFLDFCQFDRSFSTAMFYSRV